MTTIGYMLECVTPFRRLLFSMLAPVELSLFLQVTGVEITNAKRSRYMNVTREMGRTGLWIEEMIGLKRKVRIMGKDLSTFERAVTDPITFWNETKGGGRLVLMVSVVNKFTTESLLAHDLKRSCMLLTRREVADTSVNVLTNESLSSDTNTTLVDLASRMGSPDEGVPILGPASGNKFEYPVGILRPCMCGTNDTGWYMTSETDGVAIDIYFFQDLNRQYPSLWVPELRRGVEIQRESSCKVENSKMFPDLVDTTIDHVLVYANKYMVRVPHLDVGVKGRKSILGDLCMYLVAPVISSEDRDSWPYMSWWPPQGTYTMLFATTIAGRYAQTLTRKEWFGYVHGDKFKYETETPP